MIFMLKMKRIMLLKCYADNVSNGSYFAAVVCCLRSANLVLAVVGYRPNPFTIFYVLPSVTIRTLFPRSR